MKELFDLYMVFVRIGAVAFGGGYAMMPILEKELIEKRGWITSEELVDYFAIGQCTPGIIAINVSTFVGVKKRGIPGAIIATLGFVTVPIVLIFIIAMFLKNFADNVYVKHAFAGIRVCVCVLIVNTVINMWKKSIPDIPALLLFISVALIAIFKSYLPISVPLAVLVIIAGVCGVIINNVRNSNRSNVNE